ncbi:MAG: toxin [Ignavibacteria bacterium]|nr:toxin [Ignavibacteria bacterium]
MSSKADVESFLTDLKQKIKVFDLIIVERDKNRQTLTELEMKQSDCKKIIDLLSAENYYRGPKKDSEFTGEYWEFGVDVNGRDVYIKVNYGKPNKQVICISFHFAEHEIKYKYKQ